MLIYRVLYLLCQAEVAELADAQASGACGSNIVWVQVPSSAYLKTGNLVFKISRFCHFIIC